MKLKKRFEGVTTPSIWTIVLPASSIIADQVQPQRKRKHVSYKEAGGDGDDNSEDENGQKKKKKNGAEDKDYTDAEDLLKNTQKFPVVKPRSVGEMTGFSIPAMRGKNGEEVESYPEWGFAWDSTSSKYHSETSARPDGGPRDCVV